MTSDDGVDWAFAATNPWLRLRRLYRPEARAVALGMLAYLFKASPLWILPVVTANIVDIIAGRGRGIQALWWNAAVGAMAIVQNVPAAMLYARFMSRALRNTEVRLRSALIRRFQMLSIGYHARANAAALQTKVLRDTESIEQMGRQLVDTGELAVVSILFALIVTAVRMPRFVPVFLVFIPCVLVVRRFVTGTLSRRSEVLRREIEEMSSEVQGMIGMIPVTRAHAVEDEEVSRLDRHFGRVRAAAGLLDSSGAFVGATGWVVLMLVNLGGLTAAAWLSWRGILPISPGDLVLLAGFFNTIMTAVLQLNAMLPVLTRGLDALRSIGEVIGCPDMEDNRGKPPLESVEGAFHFEEVGFRYPGVSVDALSGISLEVRPGEVVGIVGPSGSGKSTLASLLTGFHRPSSGRILIDGHDMMAIDLRSYRRRLAVVAQQTILFDGTLRENIVYGASGVDEGRLLGAIRDANAADFIAGLPGGLETRIGRDGVQLSGGQRQRIAIARAILRDPSVLILDEATSALDREGEAVVREALGRLMKGRTTFIITHRPALLEGVGRILRLEEGRLIR